MLRKREALSWRARSMRMHIRYMSRLFLPILPSVSCVTQEEAAFWQCELGEHLLSFVIASAMADPPVRKPSYLAGPTTSSVCIALLLLTSSCDLIC